LGGAPRAASRNGATTATVTLPSGEKVEGRLVRVDDFLVTIALEDGTTRTIRRNGDEPKVEIRDPREGHSTLLAALTNSNMHDLTAYLSTLK
jgi:cytochrome c oxidase cbb3-type subunit 3